jgi:hypothetical protein
MIPFLGALGGLMGCMALAGPVSIQKARALQCSGCGEI